MDVEDILRLVENPVTIETPVAMEMLNIHKGYGQNFGYVMYRCNQTIPTGNHTLTFTSMPLDRAQVFVNGKMVSTLDWKNTNLSMTLTEASLNQQENRLDILVENHGRVNYVQAGYNYFNEERKGINGDVHLNGNTLKNWTIFPLEMKQNLLQGALESKAWKSNKPNADSPTLCTATLHLSEKPKDTFLKLPGWIKGTVYVNNFNLGRYWTIGPQQTLYVPGPILKKGNNTILVFEQHKMGEEIVFQDTPILS
ncbi:hypothetical protein CHS0354_017267 [Potamilus streckersoni]|uniref:Beta-galactosidase n=1 Tax=Potamilus streckersoni TaxID=2493646 RepID=A0AAE0S6A9_9BIVA|nr:hypothetical protein CHS0354_017267 [Potamilus streckersoni]